MKQEPNMKTGIRNGKQHCKTMKLKEDGIVFLNILKQSKRNVERLKKSTAKFLEMVGAVDPKRQGVVWKKQHHTIDDRGQRDLLLVFGNKVNDTHKAKILLTAHNCMLLDRYKKKYCCDKPCHKKKV